MEEPRYGNVSDPSIQKYNETCQKKQMNELHKFTSGEWKSEI